MTSRELELLQYSDSPEAIMQARRDPNFQMNKWVRQRLEERERRHYASIYYSINWAWRNI